MVYHLDVDSGDIVPLVDLSSYDRSELPDRDTVSPSASELIPTSPVLSPDYRAIIVANHAKTQVLAFPFDGQFGEPITLVESEELKTYGATAMAGSDGTLLIGGNLFIPD